MKKLKRMVQNLYPDETTQPKVLGPAGFYDEKWFNEFLLHSGPDVVDGLTHHIYNLGAGVDKTLIDKIRDPFFLSQVAQTYKDVSNTIDRFGPWAGAWVGEAGGAYNSGGKDVSHTFPNGFWYIDQLGMTSTYNHKVFCRQALVGGNYALLNTTSFVPNPDYYGALLWHRLMGSRVLRAIHSTSPYLRVYAHCARQHPGVTLVVINLSNTESYEVYMEEYARVSLRKREEYHMTPMDGDIQSDVVLLNGKALRLTESEDIPEMKPKLVDSSTPIHVKQDSIVFLSLKDFTAPAWEQRAKPVPMGPAVDLWKETEIGKTRKKYEKLSEKILLWEDKKRKKAKRKLHRTERGVEKTKMKAMQRFRDENESIEIIVASARAHAYESRTKEELKVKEKANLMRTTGRSPSTCL